MWWSWKGDLTGASTARPTWPSRRISSLGYRYSLVITRSGRRDSFLAAFDWITVGSCWFEPQLVN